MNRSRLVLRVLSGLVLAGTAACSLTAGFDGFVGARRGSDGGGEHDAEPAPEPGEEDAEGGGSHETDAAIDGDAADPNGPPVFLEGGTFCTKPGAPTGFCEDFDTADLPVRWLREGVYAKLTSYSPKSSPNVFLVDAPASTTGGTFVSKISKSFDTSSTSFVLGFDFKPERVNLGSSFFILAALEWTRSDSKYSLRLVYSNGDIRLEESNLVPPPNNKDAYHPFFSVPTDKWTRVTLDVIASGGAPSVQLLLDGSAVGTRETITPTPNLDPRPTLILGAVFAGNPHTGWTLRYDDVTLSFR